MTLCDVMRSLSAVMAHLGAADRRGLLYVQVIIDDLQCPRSGVIYAKMDAHQWVVVAMTLVSGRACFLTTVLSWTLRPSQDSSTNVQTNIKTYRVTTVSHRGRRVPDSCGG